MKKLFFIFVFLVLSQLSTAEVPASKYTLADALPTKEVVVLVPGFFNSFAPEYFSQDIVRTFEQKGFKVFVAEKLDPVGSIEENGSRLLPQLKKIFENETGRINIVSHSAGGLYSLYAIFHGKLNVKNLITISTPYAGIDFLQVLRDHSAVLKKVTDLAYLQGLRQLTPPYVDQFLKTIRVPDDVSIYAYGGYQPRKVDVWNAKNLSSVLILTDTFIPKESDGIVSFVSSQSLRNIKTDSQKSPKMYIDPNYVFNLEHWEQVLDYKHFVLLGTRNVGIIRDRQIEFYTGIANLLVRN